MAGVFLIGMPGSGKSTLGKLLAQALGYSFVDLDLEIEAKEGATIEAIFELKGEAYFRQIEAQVLETVVDRKDDFVMATGGGTPCFYNGLSLMQEKGKVVFLNVSPAILFERLTSDTKRPLLKQGVKARIEQLYGLRIDVYRKADLIIEADFLTSNEVVAFIQKKLQSF